MGAKQSVTKYQSVDNYQNNKTEEPTNTNRVTLDEAYDSLEDYKQCINNVYCLNKILDDLIEELIITGYVCRSLNNHNVENKLSIFKV